MRRVLVLNIIVAHAVGCRSVSVHPQSAPTVEAQMAGAFRVALTFIGQNRGEVVIDLSVDGATWKITKVVQPECQRPSRTALHPTPARSRAAAGEARSLGRQGREGEEVGA